MRVRLKPFVAPLVLSALVLPTFAQDAAKDLRDIVQLRLQEGTRGDVDTLWDAAQKLAIQVGDEFGAAFDQELDRELAQASKDKVPGKQVLFLVAARVYGEELDAGNLAGALMPLLEDKDSAVVQGALNLMPLIGVDSMDEPDRGAMTASLLDYAEDENHDARLRVLAAMTGHKVGLGRQVPRARRILGGFLQSENPVLRGEGALALAQLGVMGDVPGVQAELENLTHNPGPRGQLADALLKQERLHTYYENAMARAREDRESMVSGGAVGKDIRALEDLIAFVQRYHLEGPKFTREELLDSAYNGLLGSLDQHSAYFSSTAFQRFEQDLEAEYGGIGAYVGIDREDGLFTITRPLYSGPAYKAGILSDDKIVRIGEWPTIGQEIDEVIKRLKGRPGTPVKIYIWRKGMDPGLIDRPTEEMAIEINRDTITIPPVHSELLPGGVGLVELTTFSKVASSELETAIQKLMAEGATSLVLDLRNNSGGLLVEARNVANLFLPKGKLVVSTVSKIRSRERKWETQKDPIVPAEMPVAVLINRFSASASEIVSGALQDHGRATLIGQRSYGKGSVQTLFTMPGAEDDEFSDENNNGRHDSWEPLTVDHNGNGEFDFAPRVKLTIERYLLPTGRSIHRETDEEGNILSPGGVEPDVEVVQTRYDGWKLVEMRRVQDTRKLRGYVDREFPGNKELFTRLAQQDMDNTSAYPGFDDLYKDLGTVLSKQDVRFLLRMEVRRRVQDERGSAFPMGDFESDHQLQVAIEKNLEKLGQQAQQIDAYARSFDADEDPSAPPALLAHVQNLRKAIDLLGPEGHQLSADELKSLRELLEEAAGQN
ncbi:MAG: S41 family peptidase [Planctomycetota bacterium]